MFFSKFYYVVLLAVFLVGCGSSGEPAPDPTPESIPEPTPTPEVLPDEFACGYVNGQPILISMSSPTRIEAENYDTCITSFLDTTLENQGGEYRTEDVDITKLLDQNNNFIVTDIADEEFLKYTVNVSTSGLYELTYRIKADNNAEGKFTLSVIDNDIGGSAITFSNDTWASITREIYLTDGLQIIKLNALSAGAEIDYLELKSLEESVISPTKAVKDMQVGINLGNTLDAKLNEGDWAPKAQLAYFKAFKSANFKHVRLPVTWHNHVDESSPFKIDEKWLNRVEEVTDWALAQGYFVILNAHHESWLKEDYTNQNNQDRFDAIWLQIVKRFKHKSARLMFEILNEPHGMEDINADEVNERILSIIRKDDPTRLTVFSGAGWTPIESLIAAAVPEDNYLIGNFHLYRPWKFAGTCVNSWGTQDDLDALEAIYDQATAWSVKYDTPVMINEFGVAKYDRETPSNVCKQSERLAHLQAHVDFSHARKIGITVWDDNKSFGVYDRLKGTWGDEKDILVSKNTP